jgi:hypothetical protein
MAKVAWISGDKYAFTQENVDKSPNSDGVYGLVRGDGETKVYIGGGNIRSRLQSHFGGGNSCITREKPTHYYREVTQNWTSREKELIGAYDPICNKKVG